MIGVVIFLGLLSLFSYMIYAYKREISPAVRLCNEYLDEQYKKYGYVYTTYLSSELSELITPERLEKCYGIDYGSFVGHYMVCYSGDEGTRTFGAFIAEYPKQLKKCGYRSIDRKN